MKRAKDRAPHEQKFPELYASAPQMQNPQGLLLECASCHSHRWYHCEVYHLYAAAAALSDASQNMLAGVPATAQLPGEAVHVDHFEIEPLALELPAVH